jgi:hypothetical protein
MKHLKLYEELSPDLLRRAGAEFSRRGHPKRGQELINYSYETEDARTNKRIIIGNGLAINYEDLKVDIDSRYGLEKKPAAVKKEPETKKWWELDDDDYESQEDKEIYEYLYTIEHNLKLRRYNLFLRVYADKLNSPNVLQRGQHYFLANIHITGIEIKKQTENGIVNILHVQLGNNRIPQDRKSAVLIIKKIKEFLNRHKLILDKPLYVNDFYRS